MLNIPSSKPPGPCILSGAMNDQSVDRLMDIILQMKINLGHISEILQQQTFEIRDQLVGVFDEGKHTLDRDLSIIDEKLTECSKYVSDYQRRRAKLIAMREKLIQLGAEPGAVPCELPEHTFENIIAWRLRALKDQGKL